MREKGEDRLLTSAIPQLGFVCVSVQRTGGQISPEAAGAVLKYRSFYNDIGFSDLLNASASNDAYL